MSPAASWSLDPAVLIGVVTAGGVYLRRWRQVCAEAGARTAGRARAASFLAGLLLILVALITPLDRLSDQLFFLHMVQHVLLLDLVPILLICAQTKLILRPVTRRLVRLEHALGPVGHPVFAIVLYVGAVWSWHIPALYDAALAHPAVHVLEHTTYSVAGGLYWWHLLSPIRSRRRLGGMGPAVYMAATKLLVGLLGIVLVFDAGSIYPFYVHLGGFWGLSPHSDQALAGGVMALEQSLVMGVALAVLFARMLTESEREAQRADRAAERGEGGEGGDGGPASLLGEDGSSMLGADDLPAPGVDGEHRRLERADRDPEARVPRRTHVQRNDRR